MRPRSPRELLLMLAVVQVAAGCDDGGGVSMDYVLTQHETPESVPWQTFGRIGDLCTGTLCYPHDDPGCFGTDDTFGLSVERTASRIRTVFFEGGPQCETCAGTAPAPDGQPLFGPGTTFRTGGGYAVLDGEGDYLGRPVRDEAGHPLAVGHVRDYDAGECSYRVTMLDYEDEDGNLHEGLRRRADQALEDRLTEGGSVYGWVEDSEVAAYLGNQECRFFANTEDRRDFIRYGATLRVTSPTCGTALVDLDAWARFVVTEGRSEWIYCPEGSCQHYLECDRLEDCDDEIAGAVCNTAAGHCEVPFALDLADYGVRVSELEYQPDAWLKLFLFPVLCHVVWDLVRSDFAEVERGPYRSLFAPMLADLREQYYWYRPDDSIARYLTIDGSGVCDEDSDCVDLALEELESRCRSGTCQVRPYYIYGANLYPHELEVVLARSPADAPHSTLSLTDLCSRGAALDQPELDDQWLE